MKAFVVAVCLELLLSSVASGQTPLWSTTVDPWSREGTTHLLSTQDSHGALIVVDASSTKAMIRKTTLETGVVWEKHPDDLAYPGKLFVDDRDDVYVQVGDSWGNSARLLKLRSSDGAVLWNVNIGKKGKPIANSVLTLRNGDLIHVGCRWIGSGYSREGFLNVLDPATGKVLSTTLFNVPLHDAVELANGDLLVSGDYTEVYRLRMSDRTLGWRQTLGGTYIRQMLPVGTDAAYLVGDVDSYDDTAEVSLIDLDSGIERWRATVPRLNHDAVVDALGNLVLSDWRLGASNLEALSRDDGHVLWSKSAGFDLIGPAIQGSDGLYAAFADANGAGYHRIAPETGAVLSTSASVPLPGRANPQGIFLGPGTSVAIVGDQYTYTAIDTVRWYDAATSQAIRIDQQLKSTPSPVVPARSVAIGDDAVIAASILYGWVIRRVRADGETKWNRTLRLPERYFEYSPFPDGLRQVVLGMQPDGTANLYAGGNMKDQPTLLCLNPDTGKTRWSANLSGIFGPSYVHKVAAARNGDAIVALSQGQAPAWFVRLRGSDGKVLWFHPSELNWLGYEGWGYNDYAGFFGVTEPGDIVASNEYKIFRTDSRTGATVWEQVLAHYAPGDDILCDHGGNVFVVSHNTPVVTKIDYRTGLILYESAVGEYPNERLSNPVLLPLGRAAWLERRSQTAVLVAVDLAEGSKRWEAEVPGLSVFPFGWMPVTLAYSDGILFANGLSYGSTPENWITCAFDVATRQELWTTVSGEGARGLGLIPLPGGKAVSLGSLSQNGVEVLKATAYSR